MSDLLYDSVCGYYYGNKMGFLMNQKEILKQYYELIQRFGRRKSLRDSEIIIEKSQQFLELLSELENREENDEYSLLVQKMLGISLIEIQDYREAKNILLRILERYPDDPETLNAMAYIYIIEKHLNEAVRCVLDALYFDKENEIYKKNLETLRNTDDPDVLIPTISPKDFIYIKLPDLPFYLIIKEKLLWFISSKFGKSILISAGIIILSIIIYYSYPYYITWVENYRFKRSLGHGRTVHLEIKDIEKLVAERSKYNLKLSEEEIKKKFSMIKYYLEDKKVNKAIITINELLNSNASEQIKERVTIWEGFVYKIEKPSQIDYVPPIQDVLRTPFLYKNVYINWGGTVVNLEHKGREETVFDLLINFIDEATVEGIAEVHLEGFVKVSNNDKVYVFGQIAGINLDNHIIVKGISIQSIK